MKFALAALVLAFAADVPLDNPAHEARAQALMREIRCVACENEPVSQSTAPIAEDMRRHIREMVAEGASDREIRDWFESRYGEFVLFRPPVRGVSGILLWILPFVLLAGGAVAGILLARSRSKPGDVEAEEV
jgi:cytochrome c-type biogenesis protein CcmH